MRLLCFGLLGLASIGCGVSGASGHFTGGTGASTSTSWGGSTTTTTFTTTTTQSTSGGGTGGTWSSSSSSTSSTSGTGGTGGSPADMSGDCHADADCPSGHCIEVTSGGFRVCLVPPVPATTCTSTLDQCCPATQKLCADQAPCFAGPLVPVCVGIPTAPHNVCGVDQCAKDVDCAAAQICAPAGALGLEIRACIDAHCKVDADCTAHAGGICAPVEAPCCAAPAGLFCVYPGDGCRQSTDCPPTTSQPSRFCSPDAASGVASCQPGGPVCPA